MIYIYTNNTKYIDNKQNHKNYKTTKNKKETPFFIFYEYFRTLR